MTAHLTYPLSLASSYTLGSCVLDCMSACLSGFKRWTEGPPNPSIGARMVLWCSWLTHWGIVYDDIYDEDDDDNDDD